MSQTVSWSYTTVNTLRQCNRKYYYASIMATHGRKNPARRKAYELKQMQTLQMWQGSVVDKFMEKRLIPAIAAKQELNFELLADSAVEMAKKQYNFSRLKKYNDPGLKKGDIDEEFCILDIHELGKPYKEDDIQACYQLIKETILGIPSISMAGHGTLLDFLKALTHPQPNVMNWLIYIEQAKVNPQIDLLGYYQYDPVVIDWKLSASYSSDYSRQLLISGLTIYFKRLEQSDKKPYAFEKIRLYEVNLLKKQVKRHEFDQEEQNNMIDYINLTARDMYLLTGDKKFDDFDINEFEQTDNQSTCRLCSYRSLCSYMLMNNNCYDEKTYLEHVSTQQYC